MMSLTNAMSAGARRPAEYVYSARMMKAAASGSSPVRPSALITTSMPMSCSAMYGIVATTPVSATANSSAREP